MTRSSSKAGWELRAAWNGSGDLVIGQSEPLVLAPPGVSVEEVGDDPALTRWRMARWRDFDALIRAAPPESCQTLPVGDVLGHLPPVAAAWVEHVTRSYVEITGALLGELDTSIPDVPQLLDGLRTELEDELPLATAPQRRRSDLQRTIKQVASRLPTRTTSGPSPTPLRIGEIYDALSSAPAARVERLYNQGQVGLDGWTPTTSDFEDAVLRLARYRRRLRPSLVLDRLEGTTPARRRRPRVRGHS